MFGQSPASGNVGSVFCIAAAYADGRAKGPIKGQLKPPVEIPNSHQIEFNGATEGRLGLKAAFEVAESDHHFIS